MLFGAKNKRDIDLHQFLDFSISRTLKLGKKDQSEGSLILNGTVINSTFEPLPPGP